MKKILAILGVLVLIVVGLNVAPATLSTEKSIVIEKPLNEVLEAVTKFENFKVWSPWSKMDPGMNSEIVGQDGVVGTKYSWSSENEEVGTGSQTITSVSNERIEMDLAFTAPWESEAKVYFDFKEVENGVEVSWGFKQEANMMMTFMGIEEMVGQCYEDGLNNLKEYL